MRNDSEIRGALRELAEVFGARSPGDQAMSVWLRTLDDVDGDAVLLALSDWPRHHRTMPCPADIRTEAIKRVSTRIETDAKRNAEQSRSEPETEAWVRSIAPESVRLAMESYLQSCKDPNASDRRWIDRLIGYWARGWYETRDYRVERDSLGRVTQVKQVATRCTLSAAQEAVVKRAFGGTLPAKDHPRVRWCLRSVEEQEARERLAPSVGQTLSELAAMHGAARQPRQMPEPPDWI